ncbi:MAG: GlsB/YeaQ/YmgE family stress response membrane protein [Pseudomonadota bacterium]|nr:GlsB/YeaQ/YmgE family stress response membrane protein [Pseudomonadota bacterium]
MHLIWTILIGFVCGLIAKAITPGAGPSGFWLTAALGIAGSIAATYLGQALHLYQPGEPAGFFGALVGAVVLLVIYHLFARRSP